MKSPLKFSLFSVLYLCEDGIWEYEVYDKLKKHYNQRALSKVRSILLELHNKSWTDEVDQEFYKGSIIRKYKLQARHRDFVDYHLSPLKITNELGISSNTIEKEELSVKGEHADGYRVV